MATITSINSNVAGNNTFLGSLSGNLTLTGQFNVGVGSECLNSLTNGTENVGLGYNVLTAATTAQHNVCVGNITGTAITTGGENTILGSGSGAFLTTGSRNILLGYLNGANYTTVESDNIILAYGYAGNPLDANQIIIGVDGAGAGQQTDCYIAGNTHVTRNLMLPDTNAAGTVGEIQFNNLRWISNFGVANTFVGGISGNTTLTGTQNSGFGGASLTDLTTGSDNSFCGFASGSSITDGNENSGLGSGALIGLLTGSNNIAVGYSAGAVYTGAESSNICIGHVGVLGEANTIHIGTDGNGAGQQDTCFIAGEVTTARDLTVATGDFTVSLGNIALPNTNGAGTTGEITFGGSRWISNFGTDNTFVGSASGNTTLTGVGNCAFGIGTLSALALGGNNIGLGKNSLANITNGSNNVAIGAGSGIAYTVENFNISIGDSVQGTVGDQGIIRIGDTSPGIMNKCFIAGATGITPDVAGAKLMIIDGLGQVGSLGAATNGQLAIGSTGANPVLATITAGTGISITNGAGSVSIANSSAITWTDSTIDETIVPNHGYRLLVISGTRVFNMDAASAYHKGDIVEIAMIDHAYTWEIDINGTDNTIHYGDSFTTALTGKVSNQAGPVNTCITMVCTEDGASCEWVIMSAINTPVIA